jgi:HEAT repeat protein
MNREGVKKLLADQAWDEIARLAVIDRRVLRVLLSLLYEADDYGHWLAVEAIGRVGAATAADHPEKTRELVRRLLWTLNDESGGTPWGATGAIGAIVAARPDIFGQYLSMICPFHDDPNIYPEFIWSLARVAAGRRELTDEYRPFLLAALGNADATVRGYAAWCLGILTAEEAGPALAALRDDGSQVAIYEGDGVYRRKTVGAIAAASLAKVNNQLSP